MSKVLAHVQSIYLHWIGNYIFSPFFLEDYIYLQMRLAFGHVWVSRQTLTMRMMVTNLGIFELLPNRNPTRPNNG